MRRLNSVAFPAGCVFAFLAACQPVHAVQSASVTVNCAKAKLQTAIDAALPGVPTTIQVSGTCIEQIEVPAGKSIVLRGNGKAELKPPSDKTDQPVLLNKGDLQLEQMKITNTAATSDVVLSANSSSLVILGSTITGGNAEVTLEITNASSGRIFNTVVNGGAGEAVGVYNGSTVEIFGRPSVMPHFDSSVGYKSVISNNSSGMSALSCGDGSNLTIKTDGTGKVKVSNTAGTSIGVNLCSFRARNNAGARGIDVSGKANAIFASLSDLLLLAVNLSSQTGYGLSGTEARFTMSGSAISKSGSGDVWLDGRSSIKFNGWYGATSLPAAFAAGYESLSCSDESRIFASEGDLTLSGGKSLADLQAAYPDCFSP